MPRPTTKAQLQTASQENWQKLQTLIDQFTPAEQTATFPFEDRDRNLRDVLIHLYEWHQLFLNWLTANQAGQEQPFLPAPYNWKTYPAMNVGFWEKHQTTSLEEAKKFLATSHQAMIKSIDQFSDQELFTKKFFPWTGSTSLGSYAISATASHYDWAIKKLKKYQAALAA